MLPGLRRRRKAGITETDMARKAEMPARQWPEVIAEIASGFMLLDYASRTLLWQNRAMRHLFASPPPGYDQTEEYFFRECPYGKTGQPLQRSLVIQERTIGYTVHFAGSSMGLILAADISQQARQQRIAQISDVMDAFDRLFFHLAHEIGNPINSIKMTLDVLISNFQSYSRQTQLEYLGNLQTEFTRMELLLRSIRSFNDFECLKLQATDLQAFLREVSHTLQARMQEEKIGFSLHLQNRPAWAACDARALQHALQLIADNAIESLAGRSEPALALSLEADECFCRIRFRDNGCGVPAEKQEEAFLPFFSSKPHHAGLGLPLARKLLTRMNGTIDLRSVPPAGTEVLIVFPAVPPHDH